MTASDNFIAHKSFHFHNLARASKINNLRKHFLSLYVFQKSYKVMHLSWQNLWFFVFCKVRWLRGATNCLDKSWLKKAINGVLSKKSSKSKSSLCILHFAFLLKTKNQWYFSCFRVKKIVSIHNAKIGKKSVLRTNDHASKMKS